ncbi:MAG: hypothetical protein IJW79_11805 [Clostridia bacterium]|nr:hypothetical protein [Clostridia bacterium]
MSTQFYALNNPAPCSWAPEAISEEIRGIINILQEQNKPDFLFISGKLEAYLTAYESTHSPAILKSIITTLLELINDRDILEDLLMNLTSIIRAFFENGNNNTPDPSLLVDKAPNYISFTARPSQTPNSTFYLGDLLIAFEDKLRSDSEKKGNYNPSTVKIYSSCVRKELLEKNEDDSLRGTLSADSIGLLRNAINSAVARLKAEDEEKGTRRNKNEIAALNRLYKCLDELIQSVLQK